MLVTVLTLSGCGGGGDDGEPVVFATGSSEPVLQVSNGGGFVALDTVLTTVPTVTLTGDGTLITLDDPPAGRRPEVPSLTRSTLDAARVRAILDDADDAGLLRSGVEFGRVAILDGPTTTVTFRVNGGIITHSVYGLGLESGFSPPSGKRRARKALSRFIDSLPTVGSDPAPYVPTELMIYASPVPAGDGEDLPTATRVWPLDGSLLRIGTRVRMYTCSRVTGPDTAVLLSALADVDGRTRWVERDSDREAFEVAVRPVLPGDPGCEGPLAGW
ncbi:MAG: hypothetical protein GXX79_10540 [Actinomycetales bacterium]|nr:hypothetical protein [Actinomycetales bacterium]